MENLDYLPSVDDLIGDFDIDLPPFSKSCWLPSTDLFIGLPCLSYRTQRNLLWLGLNSRPYGALVIINLSIWFRGLISGKTNWLLFSIAVLEYPYPYPVLSLSLPLSSPFSPSFGIWTTIGLSSGVLFISWIYLFWVGSTQLLPPMVLFWLIIVFMFCRAWLPFSSFLSSPSLLLLFSTTVILT